MEYLNMANSGWMWILSGIVILAVTIQTIIFMRKGWNEALKLGIDRKVLWKTVTASISLSILPALPILLILFVMMPMLGVPLSWLRLSIIGSASTELLEATMGIESVGEVLGENISLMAFTAAMWAMTIGGASSTLITTCILKPICMSFDKISKGNIALLSVVGVCSMAGVISSLCVVYVAGASTSIIVCLTSGCAAVLLNVLGKHYAIMKNVADYSLTICLVFGMFVATLF